MEIFQVDASRKNVTIEREFASKTNRLSVVLHQTGDVGSSFSWLFTNEQLRKTPSASCGISHSQELVFRQKQVMFMQILGQKCGLTSLALNTSFVFRHRFYMFRAVNSYPWIHVAIGFIFAAGKVEESVQKLKHLIRTTIDILLQNKHVQFMDKRDKLTYGMDCEWRKKIESLRQNKCDVESAAYLEMRRTVLECEAAIYAVMGFHVHIVHPHTFVIRMCGLFGADNIKVISKYAFNLATSCSQLTLLCLKYKPELIAAVCLNIAADFHSVKFVCMKDSTVQWYQVYDQTMDIKEIESVSEEFLSLLNSNDFVPTWMTSLIRPHRPYPRTVPVSSKGMVPPASFVSHHSTSQKPNQSSTQGRDQNKTAPPTTPSASSHLEQQGGQTSSVPSASKSFPSNGNHHRSVSGNPGDLDHAGKELSLSSKQLPSTTSLTAPSGATASRSLVSNHNQSSTQGRDPNKTAPPTTPSASSHLEQQGGQTSSVPSASKSIPSNGSHHRSVSGNPGDLNHAGKELSPSSKQPPSATFLPAPSGATASRSLVSNPPSRHSTSFLPPGSRPHSSSSAGHPVSPSSARCDPNRLNVKHRRDMSDANRSGRSMLSPDDHSHRSHTRLNHSSSQRPLESLADTPPPKLPMSPVVKQPNPTPQICENALAPNAANMSMPRKLSLAAYRKRVRTRPAAPPSTRDILTEVSGFGNIHAADDSSSQNVPRETSVVSSPAVAAGLKPSASAPDLSTSFNVAKDAPTNSRFKIKLNKDASSEEKHSVKYVGTGINKKIKSPRIDPAKGESGPSSSRSSTHVEEGKVVDSPNNASSGDCKVKRGLKTRAGESSSNSKGGKLVNGHGEHHEHHHSHHHRSHRSQKSKKHSSHHSCSRRGHSSKRPSSSLSHEDEERPSKSSRLDNPSQNTSASGEMHRSYSAIVDSRYESSPCSLQNQKSGFNIDDALSSSLPCNIFDKEDDPSDMARPMPPNSDSDGVPSQHSDSQHVRSSKRPSSLLSSEDFKASRLDNPSQTTSASGEMHRSYSAIVDSRYESSPRSLLNQNSGFSTVNAFSSTLPCNIFDQDNDPSDSARPTPSTSDSVGVPAHHEKFHQLVYKHRAQMKEKPPLSLHPCDSQPTPPPQMPPPDIDYWDQIEF